MVEGEVETGESTEVSKDDENEEEESKTKTFHVGRPIEFRPLRQTRCARLRFDAPNKKIFRDLRTLFVKDFKSSPLSRGRDHWDLEKWRCSVKTFMEDNHLGPINDRNIDCVILILRSTIVKKRNFRASHDPAII